MNSLRAPDSWNCLRSIIAIFVFICGPCLAENGASAPQKGARVLTAGHSFHVWMPPILKQIATSAGIEGHEIVAIQSIGGSRVIQHWNRSDDKNVIKPALMAGKADVLTLSPIFFPDEGVENFARLGLEHNAQLRVTLQEFWMPFDDRDLYLAKQRPAKIDRDGKTTEQLAAAHAEYFASIAETARGLNRQLGKNAVLVVPVGHAVLALREKIIKGEAPGIKTQSELFSDALGHTRSHIQALAAYCHFAVIYGRDPAGLPVPSVIERLPEAAKLNRLLQELAWQAVTQHPGSGVRAATAAGAR